jgi:hypothetical protein
LLPPVMCEHLVTHILSDTWNCQCYSFLSSLWVWGLWLAMVFICLYSVTYEVKLPYTQLLNTVFSSALQCPFVFFANFYWGFLFSYLFVGVDCIVSTLNHYQLMYYKYILLVRSLSFHFLLFLFFFFLTSSSHGEEYNFI